MNIIEMHDLCDLLIDKADAPWFTPEEKDSFLNLAQIEFLDNSYRFFEYNEEIREKLLPLVRSETFAGPIASVNLSAINNFRYVLSIRGTLPNECGDLLVKAIAPVQLDDEVRNQDDPFNKNDNFNPGYIQENDGTNNLIQIISDDQPVDVILKYLKTPLNVVNNLANPALNIDSELSVSAHEEIVNIAVRKMLANVQDQFGYQSQSQEAQIQ